jgi:AraC family transcriptional regulator
LEHSHAEAHYLLFLEGSYLSTAAGAPAVTDRPMLIYNPPGVVHRDCFRSQHGRFFTHSVSAVSQAEGAPLLPQHALVLDGSAFALAQKIAAAGRDPYSEPLWLESLCNALLARTAESLEPVLRAAPGWLQRVCERLRDDCGRNLTLGDIAREAGVHPVHLTRVFRARLHCTPGDYLRRCRLDKAAALLASSRLRLTDVAQACGYFDQAHFTHAFRRAYGVAPSAYRRGLA